MTVERVLVVCTDAPHEHKRSIVETLDRAPDGWRPVHQRRRHKHGPNAYRVRPTGTDLDTGRSRARYDLRCELCPSAVVARAERLDQVLDRLAEAGVDTITLAALGARLRRIESTRQ